jgi:hypothetical protein
MSEGTKKRGGEQGPFRADGLVPGGYYEISRGHPLQLSPAGTRHGNANVTGALPLATDPLVMELGVDVGHKLAEDTVRAPDVSVGGVPADKGGWAQGAPPLAVEYADEGTKESDLQTKIEEFFGAGARWVWVVRLLGPRRVEVYSSPTDVTVHTGDDELLAPGVLQEPIPAAALYDRRVALDISLRNLLRRAGYRDLDAIREQGRGEGLEAGREEGREEGREAGREEGREEGELRLLCAIAERSLDRALDDDERARVRAELREKGALAVLPTVSLPADELRAWLSERAR